MKSYDIELDHISYEIHPEYKDEGEIVESRFPGYGEMMKRLKVQGAPYGCSFEKVSILSNTRKAMLVGEHAKTLNVSDEYIQAMFEAYFRDGLNIGEIDVIVKVADCVGISKEAVYSAIENESYQKILDDNKKVGRNLGINSVPTFIINDSIVLVGAQPPEYFEKAFRKLENEKMSDDALAGNVINQDKFTF